MVKPIVIITGPVGAGKSTIARAYVATSTIPSVHIEGDLFWSFFPKNEGTEAPTQIDDKKERGNGETRFKRFRTIMLSMCAAAIPLHKAGNQKIVFTSNKLITIV